MDENIRKMLQETPGFQSLQIHVKSSLLPSLIRESSSVRPLNHYKTAQKRKVTEEK
jgi:hypothetical protein